MRLTAFTIFLSAFLLLQIQPLLSSAILPWFGGSAAVWAAALLFFQIFLLLGYLYAHVLATRLSPIAQRKVHLILLAISLLSVPVFPSLMWKEANSQPALHILGLLSVTVGLPYFCLAANSPLLQTWLTQSRPGFLPWWLFSLSNLGSLLGLLTYPFLVEPALTKTQQVWLWSLLYMGFTALCAIVGWRTRAPGGKLKAAISQSVKPGVVLRLLWVTLAFAPSALLLALTNYITRDLAAFPLLWVVPLSLYLISFVLCFAEKALYSRQLIIGALPIAIALIIWLTWPTSSNKPGIGFLILLLCLGLFTVCMFCHGELARLHPHPSRLTGYYLLISLGGALGGMLVAVIAPALWKASYELPISVALVGILALILLVRDAPFQMSGGPVFGILALALSLGWVLVHQAREFTADTVYATRNFYGELRVKDYEEATEDAERYRALLHGGIDHGEQYLSSALRRKLVHYYCPDTGIARAISAVRRPAARFGVLGLGAGAMAAFLSPGDSLRYFEINPEVETIARKYFTYLADAQGRVEVRIGDGRLLLASEPENYYDLLLMDAFSSDSIPLHLITVDAMREYLRHLRQGGLLIFHISNRHIDLRLPLASAAKELQLEARLYDSPGDAQDHCYATRFVILSRDPAVFETPSLKPGQPLPDPAGFRTWTDDYANVLSALR